MERMSIQIMGTQENLKQNNKSESTMDKTITMEIDRMIKEENNESILEIDERDIKVEIKEEIATTGQSATRNIIESKQNPLDQR